MAAAQTGHMRNCYPEINVFMLTFLMKHPKLVGVKLTRGTLIADQVILGTDAIGLMRVVGKKGL